MTNFRDQNALTDSQHSRDFHWLLKSTSATVLTGNSVSKYNLVSRNVFITLLIKHYAIAY